MENIIRAKSAIYAGLAILLKEAGYTFKDVHRMYIAGGFGKFLDIEKAIILGMLPDLPKEKFEFLGNTSIKGAYLCTLSRRMWVEAEKIAEKMTYIELSVSRSFMDEYVSGLFIPHTNIDTFPNVKKLLKK
ncbi:MAG: ATP-binding protein [Candidatus Mariimomonas ferrooxydans]